MLKEVLLEKALVVHGDKYDYSLVPDEFNSKEKIPIVCSKHGAFYQTIGNHLNNARGCPTCGVEHVSTVKSEAAKSRFIESCINTHNGKYDYSKAFYVDSRTKVVITCKTHGDFEQTPNAHLRGAGCPTCAIEQSSLKQRSTKEQFIKQAVEIHGDRFDYSEVEYTNNSTKVVIICKQHGKFQQKPSNHLCGKIGCQECTRKDHADQLKMPNDVFISKASELHPNLDFSQTEYVNAHKPIKVVCKFHGYLTKNPWNLLMGHGCRQCSYHKLAESKSKDQSFYIPLFTEVHEDRYDYSVTEFRNSKEKFSVICHEHGIFTTTAANHLKGKGCPKCAIGVTGFQSTKSGTFYILKVTDEVGKFGISNKFESRFNAIKNHTCFDIEVLYRFDFQDGHIARTIESAVIASEDIQRNVVSRADMQQGFSETFYLKDLPKILSIVTKYMPA